MIRKIIFTALLIVVNNAAFSQVTLNIHLLIEGYYTGNGLMNNFGSGGCLFVCGISTNPSDADTLTVSLADPTNLAIVETQKGILQTNGTLVLNFTQVSSGSSYFIKINHRNALETWSAQPVVMQQNTSYDFTTADSMAFGNNMKQVEPGVWAIFSGDISDSLNLGLGACFQDGFIDSADYIMMEHAVIIIKVGYNCEDITGDNIVEGADFLITENAVYAYRHAMIPNPIGVNDFEYNFSQPNIIKCICHDNHLFFSDRNLNLKSQVNLYDSNGRLIMNSTLADIQNHINEKINDGVYIMRLEN